MCEHPLVTCIVQLCLATMDSPDYSDSDESTSSSEGSTKAAPSLFPKATDLGKRVVFSGIDKKPKYGVLRFVGGTEFAEGVWCGVELDQPAGKNNGSVHGIRYFTCDANSGMFVSIAKLELDAGRRSRSRPNSQPSSRATSVERKEPPSRPNTAKSVSRGSVPTLTINKVGGLSMQQELAHRLSQPLRRSSHPVNPSNRRQPMKAFATKGVSPGDREEKKPLAPFRSGGMYKAASTENIRAMRDKDKTKAAGQKLTQGMPAKKSSSERDLRNAGKTAATGGGSGSGKTTDPIVSKAKWKQLRTKSSSDILDSLPDTNSTSNKSSTTSSCSHTSLDSPWPRTSTPGNRDDLTPDGCSSPEESVDHRTQHITSNDDSVNNGFIETPEGSQMQLPITTTETPPTETTPIAASEVENCDSDAQGLSNHVTRFTAQVASSSSPILTHQSVQAPDSNGHTHKYYKNRPSGTATLDHPLTSALIKDGGARLLNKLLGPTKSVSWLMALSGLTFCFVGTADRCDSEGCDPLVRAAGEAVALRRW